MCVFSFLGICMGFTFTSRLALLGLKEPLTPPVDLGGSQQLFRCHRPQALKHVLQPVDAALTQGRQLPLQNETL